MALHYDARDPRVKYVAAFAPMTDPAVLNEFTANAQHAFVTRSSVENIADQLAGHPIWIVIGDQDERVGTDQVVRFARKLAAAARNKGVQNQSQLHVMPEPRGHTTPRGGILGRPRFYALTNRPNYN